MADLVSGARRPAGATPGPFEPELSGLVREVSIGRQGLYGPTRELLAYELSFHAPDGEDAQDPLSERATSHVISSTFGTFGPRELTDDKPVFITFTRAFLTGMIAVPVDPTNVVVLVSAQLAPDRELLLGLIDLRMQGYRIAVDDFAGEVDRAVLLELADFVVIDVFETPNVVVPALVTQARGMGAQLVAVGVREESDFECARAAGFDLYQGPYLEQLSVVRQRTLSVSQLVCVRLLHDLALPDITPARLQELVSSDPGLALRMLRAANSAGAAPGMEITSLHQALVLVGRRTLRSWVVLTLLEGNTVRNTSSALWTVLARAQAVSRLSGEAEDLGYTVGLLSGAAHLLGAEPDEIAGHAGVGPEVADALLHGVGEAGRALKAVLAHERQDWAGVAETTLEAGLVSRVYLQSVSDSIVVVRDVLQG